MENNYKILDLYEQLGFDLVPVIKDGKAPIECYDDQTEILTDKGFKFFKDLDKTEKVATLNTLTNSIEFQIPEKYINEYYNGKMYYANHKNLNFKITPNHNVYYYTGNNLPKIKTIETLYTQFKNSYNKYYFNSILKWEGKEVKTFILSPLTIKPYYKYRKQKAHFNYEIKINMDIWLEFLGWYLSEGYISKNGYGINITQINPENRKKIKILLDKLPFKYCVIKDRFRFSNKQLHTYLKQFGHAKDKFIPRELLFLSKRQLKILFNSLMLGDGCQSTRSYSTISKKLANDVYELMLKLGYVVNLYSNSPIYNGKILGRTIPIMQRRYIVRFQKYITRTLKIKHIKIENYSGYVYCVTVPNHIIFIRRNGRSFWCGNSAWTSKEHKLKSEWKSWLKDGINFGLKTGKSSNVTVIDIDTKEIPEDLKSILDKIKTLRQKTSKGEHFIFKYVPELPKTRIDSYKIDIENEGGQVVLYPSVVNGVKRELEIDDIIEMPEELKKFLLDKLPTPPLKTFSEKIKEDIISEDFNLGLVEEGNRNNALLRIGGILRKNLNITQTDFALNVLNRTCCNPPLPLRELDNIVTSLNRYCEFDERELASRILQYLKIVEDANSRDIKEALDMKGPEGKQRLEKAIKYLVKEGFLFKKSRAYHLIKKAEWKNKIVEEGKEIDFKMPYFDNTAIFRSGDMIIIGAKTGIGKTHVAMNIIKRLAEQGKIPHYISLESGARFLSIAQQLNLVKDNGDTLFNWCIHFSPTDVELEENAITIIDWLLPDDYAMTDKIYKYFAEQLFKKRGILIVFAQLMQSGDFFAKNMIDLFPALVSKFLYDNDHDGESSSFQITKVREAKHKNKYNKIPCKYDWHTKELKTIEEIEKNK